MDKVQTLKKVISWIERASTENVELLVFPEVFVPGYPVGLAFTLLISSVNLACEGGNLTYLSVLHQSLSTKTANRSDD